MLDCSGQRMGEDEILLKIVGSLASGFEELQRQVDEELQSFYWDHYENSDIISICQDEPSSKQSFTLPCYQRADAQFLSSHSIDSQNQDEKKHKMPKRSKSIITRSKSVLSHIKLSRRGIKTEQREEE